MKRMIQTIAAAALTACLAVFLFACGGDASTPAVSETPSFAEAEVFTLPEEEPSESEAAQSPSEAESTAAAKADAESTAKAEKKEQTLPDEQTILRRVDEARAVYGLFGKYRPAMDKKDEVTGDNETPYYRVTDTKFDTMKKLRNYVLKYFSEDITDALINVGMYMESDGKLYAVDAAMDMAPPETILSRKAELTAHTKDLQNYLVTLSMDKDEDGKADSEKQYRYAYAKSGDKWVFTSFEMF